MTGCRTKINRNFLWKESDEKRICPNCGLATTDVVAHLLLCVGRSRKIAANTDQNNLETDLDELHRRIDQVGGGRISD